MAAPGAIMVEVETTTTAVSAEERGDVGEGNHSPSTATVASPRAPLRTLRDVMRAPSSTLPDVIVLESLPEGLERREILDPKEDLWLSTADGRYSSPIIPLHVGEHPHTETFYVHKHILTRYEYFRKALCGGFRESERHAMDMPDEDPAIFHFLVAFLYEGRYDPLKPISTVLNPDKGKGKEFTSNNNRNAQSTTSDSEESTASYASDISAQSRRRRNYNRRRQDRLIERTQQKHPGVHRPGCGCPTCLSLRDGPPCWACSAPRNPPLPLNPNPIVAGGGVFVIEDGNARLQHNHNNHHNRPPPPPHRRQRNNYGMPAPHPPLPPPPAAYLSSSSTDSARISGEDLRTWLLAYELHLDVYIMANKFLIPSFKSAVARTIIDTLETAGPDAAVPQVLLLCNKLYHGLPETDTLLKMIFARVGFMQTLLWRRCPEETGEFLVGNPEVSMLILREVAARRDLYDELARGPAAAQVNLPSMETLGALGGGMAGGAGVGQGGGRGRVGGGAQQYWGLGGPPPPMHAPQW